MNFFSDHILSMLTLSPLFAAIVTALVSNTRVAKFIAIVHGIFATLLGIHIWYYFKDSTADLQFVERYVWIPGYGINFLLGIDGISLLLVMLTVGLSFLVTISLVSRTMPNMRALLVMFLVLQAGMIGSLVAFDLFCFYVFWEAMLIPMYFIIGLWGGSNRVYATTKFIIYTVLGSLFMLVAAIVLYYLHYKQFGVFSTSLLDLYKVSLNPSTQMVLFVAFAGAFAIKVPMWPFHTWLPDAHVEAPTSGSVILAGVLLKLGTYGFVRFAVPLFPIAVDYFASAFLVLGVIGILYGALTAWVQEDAKRLVAYSSDSHLGFIVLGTFAVLPTTAALSAEALTGAIYQMINHGITTPMLFFLVGILYEQRHTRMLHDYGGLASVVPWFAFFLIVATMGSVGLPGTGGFVGEFLILLGTFRANWFAATVATLGVLLGAVYMLTLCRKLLFGPVSEKENASLRDLGFADFCYLVPLAVATIVMGVYPELFLAKARTSINHLAENYKHYLIEIARPELTSTHKDHKNDIAAY